MKHANYNKSGPGRRHDSTPNANKLRNGEPLGDKLGRQAVRQQLTGNK